MQKSKVKNNILSWFPVFLWCSLIFFLSSFHKLQASPVGWQDFIIRKTAHFSEYAILFFLLFRALSNTTKYSYKKIIWLSFCLTVLYALSDEFHQTFVTGRSGRFFDIGFDTLGALFGLIVVKKYLYRLTRYLTSDIIHLLNQKKEGDE